jgi:hypothetical protein
LHRVQEQVKSGQVLPKQVGLVIVHRLTKEALEEGVLRIAEDRQQALHVLLAVARFLETGGVPVTDETLDLGQTQASQAQMTVDLGVEAKGALIAEDARGHDQGVAGIGLVEGTNAITDLALERPSKRRIAWPDSR